MLALRVGPQRTVTFLFQKIFSLLRCMLKALSFQGSIMEIEFTITEDEYVKANKLFTKPSKNILFFYVFCALALIIVALASEISVVKFSAFSGIIGGFLGLNFVRHIYAPWGTRRQYRQYKAAKDPIAINFKDGFLHFKSASGEGTIEWGYIYKWRENSEFLLIYQSSALYHIIPKRIGAIASKVREGLVEFVGGKLNK